MNTIAQSYNVRVGSVSFAVMRASSAMLIVPAGTRVWWRSIRFLLSICLIAVCGCQFRNPVREPRLPLTTSRFTPGASLFMGSTEPLGLAVQCDSHPIVIQFAETLAGRLAREIELVVPGIRTVAWHPDEHLQLPITESQPVSTNTILTVDFQSPHSVLPPESGAVTHLCELTAQSGLSVHCDPPVPPLTRCLQVRVLDYRPWSPMAASVRLTLFDGESMQPLAATTAAWSATEGGTGHGFRLTFDGNCQSRRSVFQRYFGGRECHRNCCVPAAAHNSPDAMTQLIAEQIAGWLRTTPGMMTATTLLP